MVIRDMDISVEKKNLRHEVIKRIESLSAEYIEEADKKIYEKVINLKEYKEAKTIFCFVGVNREINTLRIINNALESGKRVGVPRCISKGIMEVYEITGPSSLEEGKYGLLEPKKDCKLIKPEEIDFAIIPCVSSDREGFRLGYGGGYYDRYLVNSIFKAAVICREKILCKHIPHDDHDIKVNMVISENLNL